MLSVTYVRTAGKGVHFACVRQPQVYKSTHCSVQGLLQQLHKAEASKVELLQRHTGIINDLRLERDQAVISNNTLEKQVRALQAAAKQAEHSKQHDRAQIDGLQRMLVEQHELTEVYRHCLNL